MFQKHSYSFGQILRSIHPLVTHPSMKKPIRIPRLAIALGLLISSHAQAQLPLQKNDVVGIVGNALADRMQHDGWVEAIIQAHMSYFAFALYCQNYLFRYQYFPLSQLHCHMENFLYDNKRCLLLN